MTLCNLILTPANVHDLHCYYNVTCFRACNMLVMHPNCQYVNVDGRTNCIELAPALVIQFCEVLNFVLKYYI